MALPTLVTDEIQKPSRRIRGLLLSERNDHLAATR
jgi:hypothetical protein